MDAKEATDLIRWTAESIGWNIAVWRRGGSGKKSGKEQERAFTALFAALVGRKPTSEELEAMGGTGVFGGQ